MVPPTTQRLQKLCKKTTPFFIFYFILAKNGTIVIKDTFKGAFSSSTTDNLKVAFYQTVLVIYQCTLPSVSQLLFSLICARLKSVTGTLQICRLNSFPHRMLVMENPHKNTFSRKTPRVSHGSVHIVSVMFSDNISL